MHMSKPRIPSEFAFQVLALLAAVIVVHAFYVGLIRPSADAQLAAQAALQASGAAFVPERSLYVVIRDFEQEACFILMIWALAIMGLKAWTTRHEANMLERKLIQVTEGTTLLPQDARNYARGIEALPEAEQELLLPRTLLNALSRFSTTASIPAVSEAVREQCDIEADKLDSELSMVRYISWAIPSIGFIGTVRGIGDALGQAYKAVEGDISGVTVSLGVAFNSTFVALVLSIVIMFALHQLQLSQERLVLSTQRYVDKKLIRHLAAPK
jgi:biopolymer transport protein ExbB/TolQ